MIGAARVEGARRFLHSESITAFVDGAEWFAAGMAVCAFLEDLARLHAVQRGAMRCAECGVLRREHCRGACSFDVCCGEFREVTP